MRCSLILSLRSLVGETTSLVADFCTALNTLTLDSRISCRFCMFCVLLFCLEVHNTSWRFLMLRGASEVTSAGIWDYIKLHEKIYYYSLRSCILNSEKIYMPMGECDIKHLPMGDYH